MKSKYLDPSVQKAILIVKPGCIEAGSYSNSVFEKVVRPCKISQPKSPLSSTERQRTQPTSLDTNVQLFTNLQSKSDPDPTITRIAEKDLQAKMDAKRKKFRPVVEVQKAMMEDLSFTPSENT